MFVRAETDCVKEVFVKVVVHVQPAFDVSLLFAFPRILEPTVTCELSDESFSQEPISLHDYVCDARLKVASVHISIVDGKYVNWLGAKDGDKLPHHLVLVLRDVVSCTEAPRLRQKLL